MEHPAALSGAPRARRGQPGRLPRDLPPRDLPAAGRRAAFSSVWAVAAVSFCCFSVLCLGALLHHFVARIHLPVFWPTSLGVGLVCKEKQGGRSRKMLGECTGHLRPRSHFRGQVYILQGRETDGWASTENVSTPESSRNPYE